MNAADIVDYTRSLDCVHCGLCLNTCPTYLASGRESASPRGRIHMMRAVAEGEGAPDGSFLDELDYCLLCRACESVCPSGVEYSRLMEHTRAALVDSSERPLLQRLSLAFGLREVLTSRSMIRLAALLLRSAQRLGLFSGLGGKLGEAMQHFPEVPAAAERAPLASFTPARGQRRGAVAVLEGCVMPVLLGRVNRATVEVLSAAGRDVHVPGSPSCCGSLHAHNGDLISARRLARETIAAFDELRDDEGRELPVVVNSAGCSAHMKEYGHLLAADETWAGRAERFSARVFDFSEYLEDETGADWTVNAEVAEPIAFDDPCHLCHGQGVRRAPRTLLDRAGFERVELAESESCCGSAGLYSALRPADSRAILAPKIEALRESGARTLVTANPGCQLQWAGGIRAAGLEVEVLHIAEALERRLPGEPSKQEQHQR